MNELLDVLEQGVLTWDSDGRVQQANAAALEILGDRDLVGSTLPEHALLDAHGLPLARECGPVARARASGSRVDQVVGVRRPDGRLLWLSVRSAPLPDGTVASTFIDITVQRRVERRLAAFVEHTSDIVCEVDGHGRLHYVNPAVRRVLGWSPAELMGGFVLNFIHPEDVRVAVEAFAGASRELPAVNCTVRARARDRTWRWVAVHAATTFTPEGTIAAVELTASDVTEERAAEAQLQRTVARLKTLVETATGGILMEDAGRTVTVVSRAFCTMFGIAADPDALVGTNAESLMPVVRKLLADPAPSAARDAAVVAAAHPVRGERQLLVDGRTVARDYVPIGEGAEGGHLWIFRDVTAATRIEAQLREARDSALSATTAKSEFIATMSHEIRTPLAGISGAAALLLDDELPAPAHELVEVVSEAAAALEGLLGDVLDVSRIETGRVDLQVEDYDLRKLLAAAAGVLRPTLGDRPLELIVDVDASVPAVVRGDAKRVRQIVLNLASNAVKYSERGRVALHAHTVGDRLRVAVADTGPGISSATLSRLFEPWTRGHGREWAGTGLGLGIARKLARAMDGEVTAASVLGEGSTFTLDLPLASGAAVPVRRSETVRDVAGLRVLVAEDNRALRGLLSRQLGRLGVHATLVADGQAAVEAAAGEDFDAVLLDLRMPVMGGLEAASRMREGRATAAIFALTADTSAADAERCLAAGMDGHLAKPASLDALRAALAGAVPQPVAEPDRPGAWLDERQLGALTDTLGADGLDALLDVFLSDLDDQFERLREAVEAGARADVAARAHALRSAASAFGATRLIAATRALEDGHVGGDLARVAEAVSATATALHARRAGGTHHPREL